MRIRNRINALAIATAIVVPLTVVVILFLASDVRRQRADIAAAELLVSSATQLRQLSVETAFLRGSRAPDQWQRGLADMRAQLKRYPAETPDERAHLARIENRLVLAEEIYPRLLLAQADADVAARAVTSLFVITQEMLDTCATLISLSRRIVDNSLQALYLSVGVGFLAFSVLIAAAWRLVVHGILIPLTRIERGAQRVTEGDLSHRIRLDLTNEIGMLADSFDAMTTRLVTHLDEMWVAKEDAEKGKREIERRDRALIESEQRLRAFLDGTPDRVWMKDVRGRYLAFNKSEELAWGLPNGQLLGKTVSELLPSAQAQAIMARDLRVMTERRTLRIEAIANSDSLWREVIKAPIIGADGEVAGIVGISRDISERRTRDREQRNAFVREIHHRIKNHVQGVAGLLSGHARREPALAGPIRAAVAQLKSVAAVHGLQGTANGAPRLADMARAICAAQQEAEPCAVRIDVQIQLDAGAQVTLNEDEAVPVALVINELVSNAIKHARRQTPQSLIRVRVEGSASAARLSVMNEGRLVAAPVISPSTQGGSGLRIVRSLLSAQGAAFDIHEADNIVVASLRLSPPVIGVVESGDAGGNVKANVNANAMLRTAGGVSC